jgi:tape measure domain-containing protein
VQNQLAQMGVSEESMKRALEQLSQDTKVYVQKFRLEEIRMYTQWYVFT